MEYDVVPVTRRLTEPTVGTKGTEKKGKRAYGEVAIFREQCNGQG